MSSQSQNYPTVGHGENAGPQSSGASIPNNSEGNYPAEGAPPPISRDSRPVSGPPPPIPNNRPITPSQHPQPPHGSYPPPQGPPPGTGPQYYPPPPGAPPGQSYYPPPPGPPVGYNAPSGAFPMPMPGPFAGTQQNFPYPQAPQYPSPTQAYFPSQNQWYLGSELPPLHSQPVPHGVMKVPGYDPKGDAQAITNATKGRSLDKKEKEMLIRTLVPLSALQLDALAEHYQAVTKKTLLDVLPNLGMLNDYFGMGIHGLAAGPLAWDVELVGKALAPRRVLGGLGTDEALLNELFLGRPSFEIRLLSDAYRLKHGESKGNLVKAVKDDLSLDTAHMFELTLDPSRPDDSPLNRDDVDKDVDALYHASRGRIGKEKLYEILVKRSNSHTIEVITVYESKHGRLSDVVKRQYSGHMRDGLLYIINGADHHAQYGPGVWRDAQLLYEAMEGRGTDDKQLVTRLVRAHWNAHRMVKIKEAYRLIAKEELAKRIRSETSGSYRSLLVALVDGLDAMNK